MKRCKDKNLDEALQLLLGVSKGFWELAPEDLLPLVRSVLACQMETTSSSGSFHRLEKVGGKRRGGGDGVLLLIQEFIFQARDFG